MPIVTRSKMIAARVTDKEFEDIAKEAKRRGLRKSEFIREMIIEYSSLFSSKKIN